MTPEHRAGLVAALGRLESRLALAAERAEESACGCRLYAAEIRASGALADGRRDAYLRSAAEDEAVARELREDLATLRALLDEAREVPT